MKDKSKIIFMGTPEFARAVLEKLIASEIYKPALVITQPDKPVGRRKEITPPPVKQKITNYESRIKDGIKILQPEKLRDPAFIEKIKKAGPDLIIVAAYGKIIPKEILDIPRFGVLNIHASLLPSYRGASPISEAILNGDKETGATIMLVDEQLDHGPILAQARVAIAPEDTTETLSRKIAITGGNLLIETLPKWINGAIGPQEQNHAHVTHTKIISKQDGEIKTEHTGKYIEKMARAYYPWPGIYIRISKIKNQKSKITEREKTLKILKVKIAPCEKNLPPLSLSLTAKKELCLHAADGCLILETVQPEGKKPMSGYNFYLGNRYLAKNNDRC